MTKVKIWNCLADVLDFYVWPNTLFIANAAESDRFTPVKSGGGFQKHLGMVVGLWYG